MEDLSGKKKDELLEMAEELEIEGRSKMKVDELRDAITNTMQAPGTEEIEVEPEPVDQPMFATLDGLNKRVAALEARVAAIDRRTRGSSQLLGHG